MKQFKWISLLSAGVLLTVLNGCRQAESEGPALFESVSSDKSGVSFVNEVVDKPNMSIFDYLYFYNGGGVAAGDLNKDGKTDLFFVSNQGKNRLYLGKGNLQFADITEQAGVGGISNWKTGVTLADINGDGWLDIYVCAVSNYKSFKGRNELFISNGVDANGKLTFTERANEYGLGFQGFSTQAAFFDYDHDGDLDCYLLNHAVHTSLSYDRVSTRVLRVKESGDFLYKNLSKERAASPNQKPATPLFEDVSEKAGIYGAAMGYGLGISVGDINNDGWEDIYVANDFHEDDYYYINQHNGTFKESTRQHFRHTSKFSMGNDLADINNDGFLDLMTVDMYPDDPAVEKASAGEDPLDVYLYKLQFGYYNQYTRNTLQLNMDGEHFSDIGVMAGVSATDWSWSPLLADFDNDGVKDLFVSTGIVRRPNDLEYLKYLSSPEAQEREYRNLPLDMEDLKKMPDGRYHSFVFQGLRTPSGPGLQFADKSQAWGFSQAGYANGAVYADLDNDGDLDLITNNLNAPAGIYENKANTLFKHNFLQVRFEGNTNNQFGVGAKVVLKTKEGLLYQHNMPTRGFMSAVEPRLNFGLGNASVVDSLWVIWPDQTGQILTNVKPNQLLVLHQSDARSGIPNPIQARKQPLFVELDSTAIAYRHDENTYFDFSREPLMPFKVSTEGPKLAVGDVNGDGLDDFYVGGAKFQTGKLFIQQSKMGRGSVPAFSVDSLPFRPDSTAEDTDALFFDADNDKDLDLYVVSGGNEFFDKDEPLLDRLYINDGKGHFQKNPTALPNMFTNKSCVTAGDVDHDGDLDLFVGGRVVGFHYGQSPESYLLINNGRGQFSDQTDQRAPALRKAGMLTGAFWSDADKDGDLDLTVAGQWMPIRVFRNENGKLTEWGDTGLEKAVGLWQTIRPADLDGDGDVDFLAGNLGTNTKFRRGENGALRMYTRDFLNAGNKLDQVLAYRYNDNWYPVASKDELGKSLPFLNKRFDNYRDFAGKSIEDIFNDGELVDATMHEVNTFESVWVENLGQGKFTLHPLPYLAQVSAIFAFDVEDVTGDGRPDVLLGGNFYSVGTYQGRYDASYGLILRNDGPGKLNPVLPTSSGFMLDGEIRDIRPIRTPQGRLIAATRNNMRLQLFKPVK